MINVSEAWRRAFPGAHLGVLAMTGVANPACHEPLAARKKELETELRARYGGFAKADFRELAPIRAYEAYYRRWDKSYHVLAQVESVAVKGKPLPAVAALVEAMFMAELKNMLLTAGHDCDTLAGPLILDVAAGGEGYVGIRGRGETAKAGDMLIRDQAGIISSVLHGPDLRTSIKPDTQNALFVVYAPDGIGEAAVFGHLRDIEGYARLVAPAAATEELTVL